MSRVEQTYRQLLEIEREGAPLLTVSLDLSPGTDGIPSARQVMKQMWRRVEERFEGLEHEALRSYRADQELVESAWEPAIQRGSRGLMYVGSVAGGVHAELELPYAIRHSAYLWHRPWLFELARYRYLAHRPITVAMVDSNGIHAIRVEYGEIEEEVETGHFAGAVSGAHGRTDTQGIGGGGTPAGPGAGPGAGAGAPDAAGGWHGKTRIEKSILAHQQAFAREDAGRLADLADQEDILVVAGPEEPRVELVRQLSERIRNRVIQSGSIAPTVDEQQIAEQAMELVVQEQYRESLQAVERWRQADPHNRGVAGAEGAISAMERGQLGTLILHEDIATHFGDARDAREQSGLLDSHVVDALLRMVPTSGAELMFTGDDRLLEEQPDGVVGLNRW